ncbi:MAG TPA: ABC transporter substrate-binding protein [Gaiellaceae bacterium]|jgi:peptide/nickel transport system substrate-binding protein|nr:ABC transporter substrate-binding protein [Gaiellaceae bacterium]
MSKPRKLSAVPRRIVLPAAAVLVAALFLAVAGASAHTDSTAAPAAKASKSASTTLTWALGTNPASLFGPYYFSTSGAAMMSLVYQTGLAYGTYGQLQPQVISSWKQTSPTRYVYTVKPGQKFSDGTPVTAKDVAFSLAINVDPKIGSRFAALFVSVKRITASGNQVIVTLKQPDSTWRYVPAQMAGYVFSKASYQKNPNAYGTPTALPVGSGPYKYQSFQPNSQVVLVRNPHWTGKKYPWDKIVMPIIPNAQALLLALQNGTVDGTFDVPSSSLSQWIPAQGIVLHTFPSAGWRGFSIDMTDGPFADLNVRKAIAYSIDKAGLVKALLYGAGQPLKCIVPPSMFKSVLPAKEVDSALAKIPGYDYDLSKAKAALKASKYPNGFTTTLNVPDGCGACMAISQNLQQSLAQIGITVKLNVMPGAPRFQVILDHDAHLGLQVLGMGPDNPDPANYPSILWPSDQAVKGGQNSSNWRTSAVDTLMKQSLASANRAAAARLILKGCALEAQQVSYIPIFTFPYAVAVKKGLNVTSGIGPFYSTVNWLQYLRVG